MFFRQRAIRGFMKKKKSCKLPDISKSPTVAFLLEEKQFALHKEIERKMTSLFPIKRLTFITFVETMPQDVLKSDRNFLITKNDFNFWGLMKNVKKESLQYLKFDMLVDFTTNNDELMTNQYIMSLTNNTFRVTFRNDCPSLYDMVIDSKKEDDIMIRMDILYAYLSMLLGKR